MLDASIYGLCTAVKEYRNAPVITMDVQVESLKTELIRRIQRLHERREPLNLVAVRRNHPELVAEVFAVRPFWGWKRALVAAGLDYDRINIEIRDFVECRICGRECALLTSHLKAVHQITGEEYREEFPDAEIYSEALRAAKADGRRKHSVIPHWEALWTPEYVLDRAAELHLRGYPIYAHWVLSHEKQLGNYGYRLFGSWDEVLRRIGVDPALIRILAPGHSLTKDEVIAQLLDRKRKGYPLSDRALAREDLRLSNAARRRFGSHRAALRAAGIDPDEVSPVQKISLEEVEKCFQQMRDIASKPASEAASEVAKIRERHDGIIRRKFGSWRRACIAAGVPYERFSGRLYADADMVLAALRNRYTKGLSVRSQVLFKADRSLFNAVIREYGSCARAAHALGVPRADFRQNETFTTAEEVIAELRRRERNRIDLDAATVSSQHSGSGSNLQLFQEACRHFETWEAALRAAGLKEVWAVLCATRGTECYPDRAAVIGAIRRLRRHSRRYRIWSVDHALSTQAFVLCGSWLAAVRAAGMSEKTAKSFVFPHDRKFSTPTLLLRAIRQRCKRSGTIAKIAVQKSDAEGRLLVRAASLCFGSWREAVRAAGIRRRGERKYPSARAVLLAIRRRVASGKSIMRLELEKGTTREPALVRAAVHYFCDWPKALKAAGFDARAMLLENKRHSRTYPDRESVVLAIRIRRQVRLPVTAAQLTRGPHADRKLLRSGTEYFGKWDQALVAADLDPSQIRQRISVSQRSYPNRDAVLDGIRRRLARSLPMNSTSLQKGEYADFALFNHARNYFGSWEVAIAFADDLMSEPTKTQRCA